MEKSSSMGIKRRGFASMNSQRRKEVASKGGKTSHERGTAHEFTPEEARMAGKKGGRKSSSKRMR